MTPRNLAILLTVAWVAITLLARHWTSHDPSKRGSEMFTEMVYSPAYEAFESNPVFPDGRTLQAPPDGSIARGRRLLSLESGESGLATAGRDLVNPLASSSATLRRGGEAFRIWCTPCHGSSGKGDGEVTKRGVPPPPSLLLDNARALPDGSIFHIITLGRKNMPAHAAQVTVDDRWKIIHYLRTLQGANR